MTPEEKRERHRKQMQIWVNKNRERYNKYQKDYRKKNKEKVNIRAREYRLKNKDKRNEYQRKYFKEYRKKNSQHIDELNKKWLNRNKEYNKKLKKYKLEYQRKKRKTIEGKREHCKQQSEYIRGKKWIQILPNIFPENISIDYHHIDGKWFVVPLPSTLHEETSGLNTKNHFEQANEWIEFYYNINIKDFLGGK